MKIRFIYYVDSQLTWSYIINLVKTLRLIITLVAVFWALHGGTLPAQQSDVSGRITSGPTVSLLSVAVDDFRLAEDFVGAVDTAFADSLQSILVDDLIFALYFNIIEPDSAFLADFAEGEMNFEDWIYIGAQMLIEGRLTKNENMYTLNLNVVDIFRNKLVYNNQFLGSATEYRYMAHRAAADLLLNLTGEEGAFFSKIAYSTAVGELGDNREIYVCDFDGSNSTRITDNSGLDHKRV